MNNDDLTFIEIFPWNNNFKTGIKKIDEQHKVLVNILNQVAANLVHLSHPIKLNKIFDELTQYAHFHFKEEEKIWDTYFYGDILYEEHKEKHNSFMSDLLSLKMNKQKKPLDELMADIVSFLSQWLAYHILDTDKYMAITVSILKSGNYTLEEAKKYAKNKTSGNIQILTNTVLSMYDNLSSGSLALMKERALRKKAEKALVNSEKRWKFIFEDYQDNIWDWNIKEDDIPSSKNKISFTDFLNLDDKKLLHIHKLDKNRVETAFKEHLMGKTEFFSSKYRILQKNGSWTWILTRAKVVSRDKEGNALRIVGTYSDITKQELASLIYQNSSQAMMITSKENLIININPAFIKITGYAEKDVIGKNPNFLSSGRHNKKFYKQMWKSLAKKGSWSGEIYNKRKNGEIYPEILNINTIIDNFGEVDYYVGLFTDITENKKAHQLILEQANRDSLTKLYNRRMFLEKLEEEIQRAKRSKSTFALLFLDLDYFKEVNDNFGHKVGDTLLIEVAKRIKKHIRSSDILARLGGDEFALILRELKETQVLDKVVQNIINYLNKIYKINLHQISISATIGISLYPDDAQNASSLLRNADQAMYRAKEDGRNCYRYFTPEMQISAKNRQLLINDLANALEKHQFQIYYQPIINLKTKEIMKAEALIRWKHPKYGHVSPLHFIPCAETSGLIIDIGNWVYKETILQTKIWNEKYNINFQTSVNKSVVEFKRAKNLDEWVKYLDEYGLSGSNSVIEITEDILMEDENKITTKLLQLQNRGIKISLDDFGTGYSSLSYLRKFNIDYLKIDRSFIRNLTENSQNLILCEAIIVMAHKFGIKVIAEGIETEEQRRLLLDIDCDYAQGYLFSRPVPAHEFQKIFEK